MRDWWKLDTTSSIRISSPEVRFHRHLSSFHSTESERNNQPFVRQKILERPKIFVRVSVLGTCTRFWYSSTVPRWSGGRSQRPGPRSSWCASRRQVSTTVDRAWTWSESDCTIQQSITSVYYNKQTNKQCARAIRSGFQLTFCHFGRKTSWNKNKAFAGNADAIQTIQGARNDKDHLSFLR